MLVRIVFPEIRISLSLSPVLSINSLKMFVNFDSISGKYIDDDDTNPKICSMLQPKMKFFEYHNWTTHFGWRKWLLCSCEPWICVYVSVYLLHVNRLCLYVYVSERVWNESFVYSICLFDGVSIAWYIHKFVWYESRHQLNMKNYKLNYVTFG